VIYTRNLLLELNRRIASSIQDEVEVADMISNRVEAKRSRGSADERHGCRSAGYTLVFCAGVVSERDGTVTGIA
jgi:hypothetical protein